MEAITLGFFIGIAIGLFTMIPLMLMLNDEKYRFRVFRVSDPVESKKLKVARKLERQEMGYVSEFPTNEDMSNEDLPEISKDPLKFLKRK